MVPLVPFAQWRCRHGIWVLLTEHNKYWTKRMQVNDSAVTLSFTKTESDFVMYQFLDDQLSAAEKFQPSWTIIIQQMQQFGPDSSLPISTLQNSKKTHTHTHSLVTAPPCLLPLQAVKVCPCGLIPVLNYWQPIRFVLARGSVDRRPFAADVPPSPNEAEGSCKFNSLYTFHQT